MTDYDAVLAEAREVVAHYEGDDVTGDYIARLVDALEAAAAELRQERERADPSKDERLVRYMAMATPLGYQSALTVVQEMTKLLLAEDGAKCNHDAAADLARARKTIAHASDVLRNSRYVWRDKVARDILAAYDDEGTNE